MKKYVERVIFFLFCLIVVWYFRESLSFDSIERYVKKIWITENKIGSQEGENFSFIITDYDGETIKGQYLASSSIINPKLENKYTFEGIVANGKIHLELNNMNQKVGTMFFGVQDSNRIEATVDYDDGYLYFYETWEFRPYVIDDVEYFKLNERVSAPIIIDTVENAKVVSGVIGINKDYPIAFLINEREEILYEFTASYKTGTTIEEIIIEDVNNDGLEDVNIVTHFVDEEIDAIQWIFYQDEKCMFYLEDVK